MLTKAEIKRIRSLGDKAGREEERAFVVEGEKMVSELLASGFAVQSLYRVGEQLSAAEMGRISFLRTPTPVLAVAEMPADRNAAKSSRMPQGLALVLDDVQDPGNVGTILRLADWFGVRTVYASPGTADCWNPKVVQATMGAIFRVRMHYGPLEPLLCEAARAGVPVYGTFLEGDDIYRSNLPQEGDVPGLLVMGNEGRGISAAVAAQVTQKLYIPPFPATAAGETSESLNVAMATAVALAEFRRRARL